MRRAAPLVGILVLAAAGCGYHIAGRTGMMPKDIKTISIAAFLNATPRYDIARVLPADLAREFHARTRYVIVTDPSQADAELVGIVAKFESIPTTSDPKSGRATGAQVVVTLNLKLTDRHTGKVLFERTSYEFRERYEVSVDPQAYFDESGGAVHRLSRDLARSVVTAILENF